jgi:hypothetical protein
MLKHAVIYLIISILAILFSSQVLNLMYLIHQIFNTLTVHLSPVLQIFDLGIKTSEVCLLVIIPVALTGVIALVYYAIKRKSMPYFIELTWIFWVLLVLSNILTNKVWPH